MEPHSRHQCLIYEGAPSHKLPMLAAIIRQNMDAGYRCLYMNSPTMVTGMRSYLSAMGIDVATEVSKGSLVLSSEPVTLGSVFKWKDLLISLEESVVSALADGYKGLLATGDMSWEFGGAKDLSELMEYEWELEQVFRRRPELKGICQYHKDSLPPQVMRDGLLSHSSVVLNENFSRVNLFHKKTAPSKDRVYSGLDLDYMIDSLCREGA
jgi:hypothetical protein